MERANHTPIPPLAEMSDRERALRIADYLMNIYGKKRDTARKTALQRSWLAEQAKKVGDG